MTLRFGFPAVSVHEAAAAAVQRVLDAHDMEVEHITGAPEDMLSMLAEGEIDLLATLWRPADGHPPAPERVHVFGQLYRPSFGWYVSAGADGGIKALSDLPRAPQAGLNPEVMVADWLLDEARQSFEARGLGAAGFSLVPQEEGAFIAQALEWHRKGEGRLFFLCQPCFLHHMGAVRPLHEESRAYSARLALFQGAQEQIDPDVLDELDALMLGNKVVSALDYAIQCDGALAEEAAEAWQRGKLLPRA